MHKVFADLKNTIPYEAQSFTSEDVLRLSWYAASRQELAK
jgi:hypothetical protein